MIRSIFPNYSKAGPGIDRNAPRKTGIPLFIEIIRREFTTLLKLNLIFLVSCIPIVTIGPAIGAMTYVTLKMVRDKPVDIYYDFREGFKKNWKQSLGFGILGGLIATTIIFAFLFYFQLEGFAYYSMMLIIAIATVIVGIAWIYIYPMSIGVNLKINNIIKNSFILSIRHIKHSIIGFLACALVIGITLMFLPMSIPLLLVLSFSFCSFISSFCSWDGIEKDIIK